MHNPHNYYAAQSIPRHAGLRLTPLVCAIVVVFGAQQAVAQSVTPTPPATRSLDPIVVTGSRVEQSTFSLPMSVDAVESPDIQDGQPRVNLSEILTRIPGLVIQNRQNYAQDLQVSSRGFGARSTFGIRGIRVIVDDIPANNPDGQGQAANINLGSTERIEVLRGPFSAIYGNASGGVIQAFTEDGPPTPTLSAALLAGSYDTARAEVKFGGTAGSVNYLANISRFDTNGYRDHSAATRDQAGAKVVFSVNPAATVTVVANDLRQIDTQDPLGLTRAQFEADPRQVDASAITFDTRKSIENTQGGVIYEQKIGSADTVKLIGYTGRRNVVQFLAVPPGPQNAPTHAGGVIDLDREFGGAALRWSHRLSGIRPLTLSAGIDYEHSKERRKGFENFVGPQLGVRGNLRRDEDNTVSSFDQYIQAAWDFAAAWSVTAGVRNSEVKFKSEDFFVRTSNPDDSGNISFDHVNPVLGVLFKATPTLNLYVNTGRGFETPTFAELAYKPDGTTGLNFALRPAESRNVEAGLKWLAGGNSRVNLAVFDTRVDDEIVPATNQGGRSTFQNASDTKRRGVEVSLDSRLTPDISTYLSYAHLNATFEQPFTSRPNATTMVTVPAGNRLPGVPRTTAYAEVAWRRAAPGFSAALEVIHRAEIFANDTNTEAAERYTVANVRFGYAHAANGWRLAEFVRVDNVADRKYIGSVIVNEGNGRFYEPAPDRSVMVGLNASYAF